MTQLSELNPSNTFEAQLLEVLKAGVPSSGVSEDFAKVVEAAIIKIVKLDDRVAEIERKLQAITTAIKEEAGG